MSLYIFTDKTYTYCYDQCSLLKKSLGPIRLLKFPPSPWIYFFYESGDPSATSGMSTTPSGLEMDWSLIHFSLEILDQELSLIQKESPLKVFHPFLALSASSWDSTGFEWSTCATNNGACDASRCDSTGCWCLVSPIMGPLTAFQTSISPLEDKTSKQIAQLRNWETEKIGFPLL